MHNNKKLYGLIRDADAYSGNRNRSRPVAMYI